MRVIITGSNGFIGMNLVGKLSEVWDVIPWYRGCSFTKADILINCIGRHNRVSDNMDIMYRDNVVAGAIDIIKEIKGKVKKVYHISSYSVYLGDDRELDPFMLGEANDYSGADNYCKAKLCAEKHIVGLGEEYKINTVILRPDIVYGKSDPWLKPLWDMAKRGLAVIPGDGKAIKCPLYVDDLARAIIEMENDGVQGGYFNLGGEAVTVEDMIKTAGEIYGKDPVIIKGGWVKPLIKISNAVSEIKGEKWGLCEKRAEWFRTSKVVNVNNGKKYLKVTPFKEGLKEVLNHTR